MGRYAWLMVPMVLLAAATQASPKLSKEHILPGGEEFSAYLVSYLSDGLKVHAMVAVPNSVAPESGYPVVIANHGYVPDPRKYGVTADGFNSRPGDYYRSVPELFASRGFLVVLPDFRGHNSSEGFEQIEKQDSEAIRLYGHDVVAMMGALDEIDDANLEQVFMWSHSMGGGVSMFALMDTDIVKASSFWSTMGIDELQVDLTALSGPVMIQHAQRDGSTPHAASELLAAQLQAIDHPHKFHSYDSDDHYFEGEMRELAADRDAKFFRSTIE